MITSKRCQRSAQEVRYSAESRKRPAFAMGVMVVAFAGLVSGILAASFPLEHADLTKVFTPEHVQLFAMVDNTRAFGV